MAVDPTSRRVSVVMSYGADLPYGDAGLAEAVATVLEQDYPSIEVIIVDGRGPAPKRRSGVRRLRPPGARRQRLIVLDINNIGLCLNAGIEAAAGRYYVQLDSDDRLKPGAVEMLLAVFEADPQVGMVIGSYEVWELDETTGRATRCAEMPVVRHEEWTPDNGANNLLRVNGAGAPRAADLEVIKQVGGFGLNDSPYARNYGEDYDLVLRISERYRIGRVWDPIYEVVRHSGGTDHSIDQATVDRNDEAKDEMRRAALRRRQALNRASRDLRVGRTLMSRPVDGLRQGEEGVRTTKLVEPLSEEHTQAVQPRVSRYVWAMIQRQVLAGSSVHRQRDSGRTEVGGSDHRQSHTCRSAAVLDLSLLDR